LTERGTAGNSGENILSGNGVRRVLFGILVPFAMEEKKQKGKIYFSRTEKKLDLPFFTFFP